ncbi:hypothetical protein D3C81_1286370 [compost metagenome]
MPAETIDFGAKYHSTPMSALFERIGRRLGLPALPSSWLSRRSRPAIMPSSGRAMVRLMPKRPMISFVTSRRKLALGKKSLYVLV